MPAPATPSAWCDAAVARLLEAGYREVPTARDDGSSVRALRRSDFRFGWLATQLQTIVLLRQAQDGSPREFDEFSRRADAWAKQAHEGFRGAQNGVACLPVLVTHHSTTDVRAAAGRPPVRQFAALTVPVLVELGTGTATTFHGPMAWGQFYRSFLGEQQRLVTDGLSGPTLLLDSTQTARTWVRPALIVGLLLWISGVLVALPAH